jgi:hypothetical protein
MRGARDPFSGKIHPTPFAVSLAVFFLAAWLGVAAWSLSAMGDLGAALARTSWV